MMDDQWLADLYIEAVNHLKSLDCKQRYERATARLPHSRRGLRSEHEVRLFDE